ncbi:MULTISPECIES: hypothetical protein [Leptospira]|uniref:Uncharacterized protein n=2 Tax=Leptospira weilii TaxID=28184 RepID=A0A828YZ43_9LEPT|nr:MULTISPECIES: hypothetical protein [Leptospira]EKR63057.1 hypothetical protein LEP1GSC036_0934 [Leptospira weilii str. 2006001853]EMJ62819.1 hypothetical protein LEP1GSC051_3359 [Leptospira sp. P2653]EMN44487.1 hypothetical protein LEP1GSC086_2820 [Leptospira weilii str. LNT 1234]EMN89593.1 hypothetical protein LEP1GSC108_3773 [Leptospira weilii str. UI 13098]MCL8267606.1 hypothetical protein [Leptospira weilii]
MIINYFKIEPSNINKSKLYEYEKYIGLPLYNEAILKYNGFQKALAIRKKLKLNSLENISSND